MTARDAHGEPAEPTDPTSAELSTGLRSLERRRPFRVGLAIGVIAAISAALLVIQNSQSIRVEWLWFDLDLPQWLLLTATLLIGAFVGQIGRIAAVRARARTGERTKLVRSARKRLREQ